MPIIENNRYRPIHSAIGTCLNISQLSNAKILFLLKAYLLHKKNWCLANSFVSLKYFEGIAIDVTISMDFVCNLLSFFFDSVFHHRAYLSY